MKANKTFSSRKIGLSIFGKVRHEGKTRWVFRFVDSDYQIRDVSFRKSIFKSLDDFENFLRGKGWLSLK